MYCMQPNRQKAGIYVKYNYPNLVPTYVNQRLFESQHWPPDNNTGENDLQRVPRFFFSDWSVPITQSISVDIVQKRRAMAIHCSWNFTWDAPFIPSLMMLSLSS